MSGIYHRVTVRVDAVMWHLLVESPQCVTVSVYSLRGQYNPYTHNKADGGFSFEQDHGHPALHEALTEGEDNACDI